VMGGNSKHMQTSHQLVLGMVCLPLWALRALFSGAGVTNRVRIITLIFCALQCCQWEAGWGGLGRGNVDNVIIKALVLKIASAVNDVVRSGSSCQSY